MVVQSLMHNHGMSERRACKASGLARLTLPYRPVPRDGSGVVAFIQAHLATNPCHGFDLLYATARHQEQPWGRRCFGAFTASCGSTCRGVARSGCLRA